MELPFTYNYKNIIMANNFILTTEQRLRAIQILREDLGITPLSSKQLHLNKGQKNEQRKTGRIVYRKSDR